MKLSINAPCSQNFENFQKTDLGGFCSSCNKNVVDFTNFSETEIKKYFLISSQNTCGQFLTAQLKEYETAASNHKKNNLGFKLIASSFLTLLSLNTINGQEKTLDKTTTFNTDTKNLNENSSEKTIPIAKCFGIITDESGFPLPGASILLKNSNCTATTDFDGCFNFEINLVEGDEIIASYMGTENQTYIVTGKEDVIKIKMKNQLHFVIGEVSVMETPIKKTSISSKIKSFFQ